MRVALRAALVLGTLTVAFVPAEARTAQRGAGATRPAGAHGGGGARATAPPAMRSGGAGATRPGGGGGVPPHRTHGQATWGHGYGHGHGHGHGHGGYGYPYYPYYGYPYYGYPYYGWWGYPAFGVYMGWGWGPYGDPGGYMEQGGAADVPGQAWVETDVRPKRARVRLDGEDVGYAGDWNGVWNRLPIEPGDHVLEFVLEGHRTLEVHLGASSGRTYHISRDLARGEGTDAESPAEPPPAPTPPAPQEGAGGYVHLSVEPPDAAVYLDGTFVGRASELRRRSASRPLPAGEHELEVVRPGYVPGRRTIVVEPEGVQELRIELKPEVPEGTRALSSPGSAGSSRA